jgi:hypothetical protein
MMRAAAPLQILRGAANVLSSIPLAARTRGTIGQFRKIPIEREGEGSVEATTIGLATWAVSLPPDSYAIRLEGDALVVHHAPAEDKSEPEDA